MPNDTTDDGDFSFEIELDCLRGHAREPEVLAFLSREVERLEELLDGDFTLMSRVCAGVGLGLYQRAREIATEDPDTLSEGDEHEAPAEIQAAAWLSAAENAFELAEEWEKEGEAAEIPERRRPDVWDVDRKFRRTGAGQRLHSIQYGDSLHPDCIVGADTLVSDLKRISDDLERIEAGFVAVVQDVGLPMVANRADWEASVSFETLEADGKHIVSADRELYNGYLWRGLIQLGTAQLVKALDRSGLEALDQVRSELPPLFSAMFPDEIELLPARLDAFCSDLDRLLPEGIPIAEARELVASHGFDKLGIVAKTWFDSLCAQGRLRKDKRVGKVAYFPA